MRTTNPNFPQTGVLPLGPDLAKALALSPNPTPLKILTDANRKHIGNGNSDEAILSGPWVLIRSNCDNPNDDDLNAAMSKFSLLRHIYGRYVSMFRLIKTTRKTYKWYSVEGLSTNHTTNLRSSNKYAIIMPYLGRTLQSVIADICNLSDEKLIAEKLLELLKSTCNCFILIKEKGNLKNLSDIKAANLTLSGNIVYLLDPTQGSSCSLNIPTADYIHIAPPFTTNYSKSSPCNLDYPTLYSLGIMFRRQCTVHSMPMELLSLWGDMLSPSTNLTLSNVIEQTTRLLSMKEFSHPKLNDVETIRAPGYVRLNRSLYPCLNYKPYVNVSRIITTKQFPRIIAYFHIIARRLKNAGQIPRHTPNSEIENVINIFQSILQNIRSDEYFSMLKLQSAFFPLILISKTPNGPQFLSGVFEQMNIKELIDFYSLLTSLILIQQKGNKDDIEFSIWILNFIFNIIISHSKEDFSSPTLKECFIFMVRCSIIPPKLTQQTCPHDGNNEELLKEAATTTLMRIAENDKRCQGFIFLLYAIYFLQILESLSSMELIASMHNIKASLDKLMSNFNTTIIIHSIKLAIDRIERLTIITQSKNNIGSGISRALTQYELPAGIDSSQAFIIVISFLRLVSLSEMTVSLILNELTSYELFSLWSLYQTYSLPVDTPDNLRNNELQEKFVNKIKTRIKATINFNSIKMCLSDKQNLSVQIQKSTLTMVQQSIAQLVLSLTQQTDEQQYNLGVLIDLYNKIVLSCQFRPHKSNGAQSLTPRSATQQPLSLLIMEMIKTLEIHIPGKNLAMSLEAYLKKLQASRIFGSDLKHLSIEVALGNPPINKGDLAKALGKRRLTFSLCQKEVTGAEIADQIRPPIIGTYAKPLL